MKTNVLKLKRTTKFKNIMDKPKNSNTANVVKKIIRKSIEFLRSRQLVATRLARPTPTAEPISQGSSVQPQVSLHRIEIPIEEPERILVAKDVEIEKLDEKIREQDEKMREQDEELTRLTEENTRLRERIMMHHKATGEQQNVDRYRFRFHIETYFNRH